MNLTIERPIPDDAEALVNIEIAAFHHDTVLYGVPQGGPPGYDSIEVTRQKMTAHHYFKIVYEGQIVGGLVAMEMADEHFHLDLIYVAPEYHNLGIGTEAMQYILRAYPAAKWTLDTPIWAVRNHHFYEKFGFVNVKVTDYEDITLITYERTA